MVASTSETRNNIKKTTAYNQGFVNGFITGTIVSCSLFVIASAILIHRSPSSQFQFLRNNN